MSIRKIDQQSDETKRTLELDNGDLEALKQVKDKYHFRDDEKLLRFALAVLLKAERNVVFVDQGEEKVGLKPSSESIEE